MFAKHDQMRLAVYDLIDLIREAKLAASYDDREVLESMTLELERLSLFLRNRKLD